MLHFTFLLTKFFFYLTSTIFIISLIRILKNPFVEIKNDEFCENRIHDDTSFINDIERA